MDPASILVILLILCGAIIMAINIFKFRILFNSFSQLLTLEYQKLRRLYGFHQFLMLFFLVGYLVVLITLIYKIHIISELFVGTIFFFGAIFVFAGIILQSRMFTSLNDHYQRAVSMSSTLKKEEKNLSNTVELLNQEIKERGLLEEDRKRIEAQLYRSQKMEAIGMLAGGVAHDLNNILSGIISYPELLLIDLAQDSPLRKPVLTIKKSGEKAAAIVDDLLTLARRGVEKSDVINLNQVINEYVISPECDKLKHYHPNIKLVTQLEKNLFNISGSSVHLMKTIMNLVSNAAEAMTGAGTIHLSSRNQNVIEPISGYEEIKKGRYAIITISDKGIGISPENISRIFEPFYTKKIMGLSGTGLGMAVVWATVKDHNGYVDIKTIKNKGTTITLYFPETKKLPIHTEKDLDIQTYKGSGEKILVVDDVSEQREITSKMLEKLNYNVTAVSSGEAAVEYINNNCADLIILDMIMDPGIDGLLTYEKILKAQPGQKTILVSGYSESDKVRSALKLGAFTYIKKPFKLQTIGTAVKNALI